MQYTKIHAKFHQNLSLSGTLFTNLSKCSFAEHSTLTLLHSERPKLYRVYNNYIIKLYRVLTVLSAMGLSANSLNIQINVSSA